MYMFACMFLVEIYVQIASHLYTLLRLSLTYCSTCLILCSDIIGQFYLLFIYMLILLFNSLGWTIQVNTNNCNSKTSVV